LLLGNSTTDDIFPVPGYRRLADKVRKIYELYGAGDRFALLETAGPHKDTPELRLGAYRWMNRWLRNGSGEISEQERPRFIPAQLKVFDRLPDDAINATIQETFRQVAKPQLPQVPAAIRAWWPRQREEWLQALGDKVFRGWPQQPVPINVRAAEDIRHDGVRVRAFDFTSEEGVDLRLWLLTADQVDKPAQVVLTAVDEPGWGEWTRELGPTCKMAMQLSVDPGFDEAQFKQTRDTLRAQQLALATIAPRGIGPTKWAEAGTSEDIHIRRRFALLGQTLDGQRVWDVRRALAVLRSLMDLKGVPLCLRGKSDMAGIVLYAAVLEPDVAALDLWFPPASHSRGPIFLNIRTILDMPQGVALAFPRPIRLYVKDDTDAQAWAWPLQLQAALDQGALKVQQVGN
jgi:hypothetical protein